MCHIHVQKIVVDNYKRKVHAYYMMFVYHRLCFIYQVLKHNLAVEKVSYPEKDNLWIGPRQADLIHLGAKFSPCMRLGKAVSQN